MHILYKTVKPLLSVHETVSSQKRAYGILDAVLDVHGEAVLYQMEPAQGILAVVCDSLMTCHVSARNMRLRCMERLVAHLAGEPVSAGAGGGDGSDSDDSEDEMDTKDADRSTSSDAVRRESPTYGNVIQAAGE